MKANTCGVYFSTVPFRAMWILLLIVALSCGALGLSAERVVILGDSLTAGYGLNPDFAYPALMEALAAEKGRSVTVVNAGVSGDTTAGGLRRVNWILREPADMLIVALGGNDALRGFPPEETHSNLMAIIERARALQPEIRIILAGMLAPPNMGEAYGEAFAAVYPSVAAAAEVERIPFILEGVAGLPELNLADGIHPNVQGHKRIAQTIVEFLEW
jgi:acyl-CoA thioesterase-1